MTFIRKCESPEVHPSHEYVKHWFKADLPYLLNPWEHPEEWDAVYKCPGHTVEAWNVVYSHPDCAACEECADRAVAKARELDVEFQDWGYSAGGRLEDFHKAIVTRIS